VVSDVPVDDEVPVVTSRISRYAGAQSFGGAHRGRVCVHVFIGVSVRVCCERLCCIVSISKKIMKGNDDIHQRFTRGRARFKHGADVDGEFPST
jgi:hypothetical protein